MLKRKQVRERGKIKFSQCFQELKNGDKVAIVREQSFNPRFPKRIQGMNGIIVGKRGKDYIIKAKDMNEEKTYIINPAHLKKLKSEKPTGFLDDSKLKSNKNITS